MPYLSTYVSLLGFNAYCVINGLWSLSVRFAPTALEGFWVQELIRVGA